MKKDIKIKTTYGDKNWSFVKRYIENHEALLDASLSAYSALSLMRTILKPEAWDIIEPIKEKLGKAIANAEE